MQLFELGRKLTNRIRLKIKQVDTCESTGMLTLHDDNTDHGMDPWNLTWLSVVAI